jgi:hypothetical protein
MPNKYYNCHWCGSSDHLCRDCPKEKEDSEKLRILVGEYFEKWIPNNYCCPKCKKKSLIQLGNNSPSCDLVCSNCKSLFEVKSKCLSSKSIPDDIQIKHGNYYDFSHRLNHQDLSLFLVIYGVNRVTKMITIRKVLYLPNEVLRDKKKVEYYPKKEKVTTLTNLYIPNYHLLTLLSLPEEKVFLLN